MLRCRREVLFRAPGQRDPPRERARDDAPIATDTQGARAAARAASPAPHARARSVVHRRIHPRVSGHISRSFICGHSPQHTQHTPCSCNPDGLAANPLTCPQCIAPCGCAVSNSPRRSLLLHSLLLSPKRFTGRGENERSGSLLHYLVEHVKWSLQRIWMRENRSELELR